MYNRLGFLVAWPDCDRIRQTIPPNVKEMYPRLTSIIDCFEIRCETPSNPLSHAQMYSNYKRHTTVKFLIACNALGAVTFLSKAYGGRISDVNLVRDCGFLSQEYHHFGDQILADRGFTMHEEFAGLFGAELITPAFIKGRTQFDAQDVEKGQKMYSVRIQVERIIGLLKRRFDILKGVLPLKLVNSMKGEAEGDTASIDKIITCCAILINLSEGIVYSE